MNSLLLYPVVKVKNIIEYGGVVYKYYKNPLFRKVDFLLKASYLLRSPFKISKDYLKAMGASDVYTYGETPLTTLEKIFLQCPLKSSDIIYDLGSGAGRTSIWLSCFTQASVFGFEIIPEFIRRSSQILSRFQIKNLHFKKQDILKIDYSPATHVFIYGTCFEDSFIEKLVVQLETLKQGAVVITVSYPLTDYSSAFTLSKEIMLPFTWGKGDVYYNIRK